MKTKQSDIRQAKRQERKSLSQSDRDSKSKCIAQKICLLPEYKTASRIALFLSLPEEIDTSPIIQDAWENNKEVYLPVVTDSHQPLEFSPYEATNQLVKGLLNIYIPDVCKKNYITSQSLDLIIAPLVAFDNNRNRIGMGGGFYDRTFAYRADPNRTQPFILGIAYELQRTPEVEKNPWDIRPDAIITEKYRY